MSRRESALTLGITLAIWAAVDTPVLYAEASDAERAKVFHAIACDEPGIQLSDAARVVTVAAEEIPTPGENDGGEIIFPDDSFGGQPTQMAYSSGSRERLIDSIVDPTAWLMNYRFRESWNWPVRNSGRD